MGKKHFGLSQILKKLLFERNMKAVDLAREVNLPPPTIHRLVTGKSTRPYRSSLKPIADYFSVTIDQLVGEQPLQNDLPSPTITNDIKTIPVKKWESLQSNQISNVKNPEIIVTNNVNKNLFALIMPDTSMEPLFACHSILIFDPDLKPNDRNYILVKLSNTNTYVFRQLLIDANHKYLKPLNPDLCTFKMRLLDDNDQIVACLVESRHNFHPSHPSVVEEA